MSFLRADWRMPVCFLTIRRTIMFIKHKFTAMALLAGASLLVLPLAHAKGPQAGYDAYEELSGTHANAKYTQSGMRGREGAEGEAGSDGGTMWSKMKRNVNAYDAYEELSGTHASKRIAQSGAQGRSGTEGTTGAAGRITGDSPLFKIPGDLDNGCSKFLRCSGEY
jgi:hypothetical protein